MTYYLGVDPGKSGGFALLDSVGQVLHTTKMLDTEAEIVEWLVEIQHRWGSYQGARISGMLERAASSPQMGVRSAFTFGRNYGTLRTALTAALIPFDTVHPSKWQRALGCLSRGDKNVTKRRAAELFPSVTMTHAIADACLIAEYCRRVHTIGASAP